MTEAQRPDRSDTAFFGHPRALGFIVATECGYAFAYYGMVTILTLYMTHQLFQPGHVGNIWGFGEYSRFMEQFFGKKTPLALASLTFGMATSVGYLTPMLGGIVGDRILGQRRTVVLGLSLLTGGFAALVTEQGFLIALLLIVLGAGMVKSNLLGQIGRLYGPDDPRRTRAFGIFLIAVNVGGFLTPLVVGTLGEKVGWTQGLIAAAVGMAFGLTAYLLGFSQMPGDAMAAPKAETKAPSGEGRPGDWQIVLALVPVLIAATLIVGTYNQAFNIFPVWAEKHVQLNAFGFTIPVTWFSAMDGILTIIGIALAIRIWAWQERGGRPARDITRVMTGCALTAIGFSILGISALIAGPAKVAIYAPILFFVFVDSAIPWCDTVIQALITRVSPVRMTTTLLGAYFLTYAAGNFLVGWLGSLYESMTPAMFWGIHAATAGGGVLLLAIAGPALHATLSGQGRTGAAAVAT